MTNDLDHMLRDLEKQVHDFTLTMNEGAKEPPSLDRRYRSNNENLQKSSSSSNADNVPLQHYKTRAVPSSQQHNKQQEDQDACDDNMCIGTILQRSATARRANTNERPIQSITHSKSLKSSTGRYRNEKVPPPLPTQEDEELRIAMQRAWTLLDSPNEKPVASTVEPVAEEHPNNNNKPLNNMVSTSRVQTVPLKTLTTRIYIDDAKTHKVVQLTNLLTTAMVVQYLRKKGLLDHSDDWTLFEIDNRRGVERPLREWEIVLDILSVWEMDASNALLVKKYSYHYTLTSESILQKKMSPMHGWLSIEYKKGKWQKRFCFIKDNAIHHAKDNKGSSSSVLCHLGTYDVYTLLQQLRASPTPFVFAIRAQAKSSIFEKEDDYMRFLAVEDQEEMKDWVLSIRYTKSNIHYHYHPNRVVNPLAHISLENTNEETHQQPTIRRHKSTRELNSNMKLSDEHTKHPSPLPRSESTRRVDDTAKRSLARSGTTRGLTRNPTLSACNNGDSNTAPTTTDGPLIDNTEPPKFSKGSLLAKEELSDQILYRQQQQEALQRQQQLQYEESSSNNNTLIQIDDRIKFAKGSLLDKKENSNNSSPVKMTRSKSVREVSSSSNNNNNPDEPNTSGHRRHVSLRRRATSGKKPQQQQHHDVPLPNNAAIASLNVSPPPATPSSMMNTMNNGNNNNKDTLLKLDDAPEKFHSRELHGRHVKPLLNFDSNERPTRK